MKIWEKVNNITGNSSKSRHLVEYINAGAKFILASLPEKFLWTVASETEVNGFETTGTSAIGVGSSIAFDKILAVYRYDGGKKRVCVEAPDNSIHIFDEAGSLLRATEMFPKFYKLGGKIFIKPDPDYNAHIGGNEAQHTYVDLDGDTIVVDSLEGDKGVVIYAAPPVTDENTDSWILIEFENVAIYYASSLDFLRLSSSYRDLCKAEVDAIVGTSGLLSSYRSTIPSYDATTDTAGGTVSIPSKVLSFSVGSTLPTFAFTQTLPSDFNVQQPLPVFSFSETLPSAIDVSSVSLPAELVLSTSLPSPITINSSLPSSFSTTETLPSDLSVSSLLPLDFALSPPTFGSFDISSSALPSDMGEDVHTFTVSDMDDALTKSQNLVDGATMGGDTEPESVQFWLNDEDSEMAASTLGAAKQELERAGQQITKERMRLENFNGKVSEKIQRFANHINKYKTSVEAEAQRINSEVGKYTKELDRESQRVQAGISKYATEVGKEQQRLSSGVSKYSGEVSKEGTRITSELSKYQAEVQKEVQRYQQSLSAYQAELQFKAQKAGVDIEKYNALLTKERTRVDAESKNYQLGLEKTSSSFNSDLQKYQADLQKESSRMETKIAKFSAGLQESVQSFTLDLNKYQAEIQKSSSALQKDVQQYTLDIQNYASLLGQKSNKFQLDMAKASSYLQESGTKMQAAGIYAQKSGASIQTSQMYYQRAISELSAITGAVTAPEQQQASQRTEQGSTS